MDVFRFIVVLIYFTVTAIWFYNTTLWVYYLFKLNNKRTIWKNNNDKDSFKEVQKYHEIENKQIRKSFLWYCLLIFLNMVIYIMSSFIK